jgi:hypothetical protein
MKIYLLSIFLVIFNFISNNEDDDYSLQMEATECALSPPHNCRDVKLSQGHLCCEIFEEYGHNVQESCELKTTYEDQIALVGSSKIINKELAGLAIYNNEYGGLKSEEMEDRKIEVQRTISITCSGWEFSVDIVDGEYSENEIKILNSNDHCLSYYNPYLFHSLINRRKVSKNLCFKASLLPSTIEAGINCGYMEIDIEGPNVKEKINTCFLYDPNVASSKILDEATRLNLNELTKKNEDDNINYVITVYGPAGKGYTFSSKTRKVEPFNYGIINKFKICFVILIILCF